MQTTYAVIIATAVLHNIAIDNNELFLVDNEDLQDDGNVPARLEDAGRPDGLGDAIRRHLVRDVFSH